MAERDDAVSRVTGLGAAYDRIAAAMYTMDTHPAWTRLRRGLVTGQTAMVGAALSPEVDLLWAYFGALGENLERARTLLGSFRFGSVPPELTRVLTTAVVGLDPAGMPVDATARPVTSITLGDLAERTERRCAAVLSQLSDVDASANAVAAGYVEASAEIDAVVALAAQLGEQDLVVPVTQAAAEVERLDLADPLAAAPGGRLTDAAQSRLQGLRVQIAGSRDALNEVAGVRDAYPQRRAALAATVAEVAAAEEAVAAVYTHVREKVADPGLGPVPGAAAVLRSRLADLDAIREHAQTDGARWRGLAADMSTVETSTHRSLARAGELRARADGLLARRNELRGRLEAYRAKAIARGLAEDGRLGGLFAAAHDLLYTAPCDLRAATRAVHAYQSSLADVIGRGDRSGVTEPTASEHRRAVRPEERNERGGEAE